jgi:RimJ/RimL family protein N-acetyltransferase
MPLSPDSSTDNRTPTVDVIESVRLRLVSMTPAFLAASLRGDLPTAAALLGGTISPAWVQAQWLMQLRLDQLTVDPALQPWLLRAVVRRQDRMMIGHIGFHTAPGAAYLRPWAPDGVEVGYTIFPPFRRQGYATEAADALMRWAHRTYAVGRFVMTISPENSPSRRIAQHFGFQQVGTHVDPLDGSEAIFVRDLTGPASRSSAVCLGG